MNLWFLNGRLSHLIGKLVCQLSWKRQLDRVCPVGITMTHSKGKGLQLLHGNVVVIMEDNIVDRFDSREATSGRD